MNQPVVVFIINLPIEIMTNTNSLTPLSILPFLMDFYDFRYISRLTPAGLGGGAKVCPLSVFSKKTSNKMIKKSDIEKKFK
jgi:hypothetical protein